MLKKIIIAVLLVSELFGSFALDNTRTSNEDIMDSVKSIDVNHLSIEIQINI